MSLHCAALCRAARGRGRPIVVCLGKHTPTPAFVGVCAPFSKYKFRLPPGIGHCKRAAPGFALQCAVFCCCHCRLLVSRRQKAESPLEGTAHRVPGPGRRFGHIVLHKRNAGQTHVLEIELIDFCCPIYDARAIKLEGSRRRRTEREREKERVESNFSLIIIIIII